MDTKNLTDADPDTLPVRQQLVHQLRAAITEGRFKPGERLVERELCERFGVSRPSIREALRQLEAECLIDIVPNRGPSVRVISAEEVLELWEVRLAIECVAVKRFALYGTEEDIQALEDCLENFEAALKSETPDKIRSAKSVFFEVLTQGSHNAAIGTYLRQLNARLSFLWSSSLTMPNRPQESATELRALLRAIRNRSPEAAQAAIVLHNEHGKAVALHRLRSTGFADPGTPTTPPATSPTLVRKAAV
ncbi:FCD domain-containing protein [Pusillimonas sp. TS35]|uniref:GntR family transcriptional regulator n=1 Tax=Paracandidimonas lactea TaxID=2895524 RepID=UPI00137022BE|nr:GntR family transcriptional regulator [Paracandidimonas lactea]MYN14252.1 FCD domain-containing protein [Pusillimonas sp. TS35]